MLKTYVQDEIRLIQQPHHAEVSGYMAAHWGGRNGFARPGHYPGAIHPAPWREEVIIGIAEHDNGWWEWEAVPRIDEDDRLPAGLGQSAGQSPTEGFNRWRRGIARVAKSHPYAALLISIHAYRLSATAFDDLIGDDHDLYRHPLFGKHAKSFRNEQEERLTREFVEEQQCVQADLREQLARDPVMADAIQPHILNPHARLLQLLDSLSLLLALNDPEDHDLHEIPRKSWDDRVTLTWQRLEENRIGIVPYPFDMDPLPVNIPARILPAQGLHETGNGEGPMSVLFGTPVQILHFELTGKF